MKQAFSFLSFNLLLVGSLFFTACHFTPYNRQDPKEEVAQLPLDEAPHQKNSLEWWYFTGHLEDTAKKKRLGVEYVFFHFTPTQLKDYLMVNMAVSDPEAQKFYYDHRLIPLGKKALQYQAPIALALQQKNFQAQLKGSMGEYHLSGKMKAHPIWMDIKTQKQKDILLHDGTGYEQYGKYAKAGYYSYPRLAANANIIIEEDSFNLSGELWYDRQWNCGGVMEQDVAWDWFSVQFEETQTELMLYRIYHLKRAEEWYGGSYLRANGEAVELASNQIRITELSHWESPDSKATYPVKWDIEIPDEELNIELAAIMPEQELTLNFGPFFNFYYWEGMSTAQGTIKGESVKGDAYVEMTNRFRIKKSE